MENVYGSTRVQTVPQNIGKLFGSDPLSKALVTTTLLFIFLVSWGDSVWDGLPRVVATLALGLGALVLIARGTHRNYSYFHLTVLVYFSWQLISMVWSPDLFIAEIVAKTTIQLLLLVALFSIVVSNQARVLAAYQAYVCGSIAASGIVIYNFLHGTESDYLRYGIENLTIDAVGVFLAIAIPIAAYLAKYSNSRVFRVINLFSIPLVLYGIFLTGTRTASIVAVIGVFYWIYTHRKASFKVKLLILIVISASVVVILSFAPKSSIDRVFSAGESISKGTLNYRSVIWQGSIQEWKESPIKGVGLGGLGFSLSNEHINYGNAHNSFIHILTENGIIGLALYLAVHIAIFIFIFSSPPPERLFLLSLFLAIIVSQLATHLQAEKITWFIYCMLAIHGQLLTSPDRYS